MKKLLTLLMFVGASVVLKAQSGEISGKVLDENGEGVISGLVIVVDEKGNNTSVGTTTDFDGNYSLKPLKPGSYNIRFSYVGLQPKVINGVMVSADKVTALDAKLTTGKELTAVTVEWTKPLIEKASTTIDYTLDKKDIKNAVTQSVGDLVSQSAGVYQQDANSGIQIRGSREGSAVYYVNGIKRFGTPKVPVQSVEQLTVIAGGIPARYGDATAGIINITTKGPASEWEGSASFQTSQGLDAYGYNQANANFMGPLVMKGKGADRHTVFGVSGSFEFTGQKDRSPAAGGVWQVKQDVLDQIKATPLFKNPTGDNFFLTAQNLTFKDMYKTSARPNNDQQDYKGVLQFEIQPAKGINLLFGGDFTYTRYHDNVQQYSLLNAENNPLYKQMAYTAFARFSHLVGDGKKKEGSTSAIQNIYYSLQVDFQKQKSEYGDESFGNKLFDYGYIGKFETQRIASYEYQDKAINGKTYEGFVMTGYQDDNVIFTPGKQNPLGSRFTEQYYQLLGAQQASDGSYTVLGDNRVGYTDNVGNISSHYALINGNRSTPIYNLWYDVGRQYNGYGIDANKNQYRARADVSFDIQKPGATTNKHSIEIGMEYEQRIQRAYSVNPLNLWDLAYNEVNKHLTLDTANPIFHVNGQRYTLSQLGNTPFNTTDSISYDYTADATQQTAFDKHLRQSLGKTATDWIDIYSVDPSKLNINMFSADELLGYRDQGSAILGGTGGIYGYDYAGRILNFNPTLDDFFKKKDAEGNYLRYQGAFRPVYAAGYISDKFTFKDLGFLVGLRVDRFDANQYVMRDEYSLYNIKTAGEVTTLDGNAVNRPSSIGDNYAVYVTKYGQGAQIAGYRNGDTWYDKYGNVTTAKSVANAGSEGILPYLNLPGVDTMSSGTAKSFAATHADQYDPNSSFVKYTPKYVIQPRLQFSFNITDKAQFFAHYDVLSQRPQSRNQLNLASYLYWYENSGSYINNPNLKPETTIDYEFGFKQVLSKTSVVTLSAYYKEYRNLVQVRTMQYAFPADYKTWGNIDFVSVKGLNVIYDLRRTGNFKMNVNYTLQFAEGTGSDDASQQYLVQANVTNFRTIFPVDYDARHLINLNLDWHWGEGKDYDGPIVGNKQIFANFGINAMIRARSGTPYSSSGTVTTEADLTGSRSNTLTLNTSRMPWTFRVDLRINKDFAINVSRKGEDKDPKKLYLSVYLWIQNLFNTKNVIHVYRYTGNANDDGFLDAPTSTSINSQYNPQSYRDLYRAAVNDPGNYSMPRRIYLGASFNF